MLKIIASISDLRHRTNSQHETDCLPAWISTTQMLPDTVLKTGCYRVAAIYLDFENKPLIKLVMIQYVTNYAISAQSKSLECGYTTSQRIDVSQWWPMELPRNEALIVSGVPQGHCYLQWSFQINPQLRRQPLSVVIQMKSLSDDSGP